MLSHKFAAPLFVALLSACGTAGVGADESYATDVQDNTDVQVVSASSDYGMFFGVMDPRFDVQACHYYDKEAADWTDEVTHTATADCTDMVADGLGAPMLNQYIEPLAWIREDPNQEPAIQYVHFRHWCSAINVTVAVKKAAYDAESFEGVGFYGHDSTLNADADRRLTFHEKDDLELIGEAHLKNGEPVLLFRFAGAGPCDTNGSGQAPYNSSLSFKPYARYAGGYERWEAVASDHRIYYRQSWDRSGDLLR